jgi:hypothetical protein
MWLVFSDIQGKVIFSCAEWYFLCSSRCFSTISWHKNQWIMKNRKEQFWNIHVLHHRAFFHFLCLCCIKETELWWLLLLQLQWQTFLCWAQIGCSMAIYWIFRCIAMALQCLGTASESSLACTMLQVKFLIFLYAIWNINFEDWSC